MTENIIKLTPEQEALIPVTLEKWRQIALSTEPCDRASAAKVVKAIYVYVGLSEPEVLFFDSPYAALKKLGSISESELKQQMWREERRKVSSQLEIIENRAESLYNKLIKPLFFQDRERIAQGRYQILIQLEKQLSKQIVRECDLNCFFSEDLADRVSLYDFCMSVLNCSYSQKIWQLNLSIVRHCGWFFYYKNFCLLCDRPRQLSFDSQNRLHAEGSPAIQFADGYSLYSYHGVTLPEKYGKLHPSQWRSEWLLSENNAELRRVLIQGIGYNRICQELQATELDSWKEYTLLSIDAHPEGDIYANLGAIEKEPIYLLKMTCPSTGFIHFLRVPPNIQSAREAISWVNWGIDPEEFSAQT